jgi:transglutaminase-like putative cysteine protease
MEARTGFSSEIAFGSISQLVQSNKVAFRVSFRDGLIPAQDQLYWRGIVFWQCEGDVWKQGTRRRFSAMQGFIKGTSKVDYTVTLEPHNQNWLFALDLPIQLQAQMAWLNADFAPYRIRPVTGRISYLAQSYLNATARYHDQFEEAGLQLPADNNIRARQLAKEWRQTSRNNDEIVAKALQFYRDNNFVYTLQPGIQSGAVPGSVIDTFLFSTRRGFCEHYATSFAYLMRAAGMPARLVGGYLGGEKNPLGGYLVVRQSAAHVWVEVLGAGHNWQRIDPTAVVAPDRARTGSASIIASGGEEKLLSMFGLDGIAGWIKDVEYSWDLVNSRWNQWVMEYSNTDQARLFSWLGIDLKINKGKVQAFLVGAVLLAAMFFIVFIIVKKNPETRDPVAVSWDRFCQKLEKAGLTRQPDQGPVDFLHHIERQRPTLVASARPIIELYVQLRYQENFDSGLVLDFRRAVKAFSVSPSPKSSKK